MESEPVQLFVYDMSKGLAKSFSAAFLGNKSYPYDAITCPDLILIHVTGKEIPGIWHTAIFVYGRE